MCSSDLFSSPFSGQHLVGGDWRRLAPNGEENRRDAKSAEVAEGSGQMVRWLNGQIVKWLNGERGAAERVQGSGFRVQRRGIEGLRLLADGGGLRGLAAFLWSDLDGPTVREGLAPNVVDG